MFAETVKEELNRDYIFVLRKLKKDFERKDSFSVEYLIDKNSEAPKEEDQRATLETFERKGLIKIVDKIYSDMSQLNQIYRETGGKPVKYKIELIKRSFNKFYNELEKKIIDKPVKPDKTAEEKWIVFKYGNVKISYWMGKLFIEPDKIAFHLFQNGLIPRKLWDRAWNNNQLLLTAEDLVAIFGLKANEIVRDAVNKTHRGNLLKKIKEACRERKIKLPDEVLDESILKWDKGHLYLVNTDYLKALRK